MDVDSVKEVIKHKVVSLALSFRLVSPYIASYYNKYFENVIHLTVYGTHVRNSDPDCTIRTKLGKYNRIVMYVTKARLNKLVD